MRTEEELSGVSLLGNNKTQYKNTYDPSVLESFTNKFPEKDYVVVLDCPEFTTLCPKTGQPDFGRIIIRYIPNERLVESKSLKLYLFSFRENGDFHEDVTNIICRDLCALMQPRYIEVEGRFNARGGISILPFANNADAAHESLAQQRKLAYFQR